ncbi:Oidioi.mRNA.OKI2018_I69.PAR.g11002.t1.cds [Oikopleura dioica]|uniref:Oidioi.mRNA.OKI2018_I69.PAR.g11002.t1.cds n=1 Tax=Oikopleura dioica TaxID=34765 RepID=A0ABN7RZG6_OIKDI|nr:Oidioi.mRNA.OKI2018_I69.PAR.g11002.t1.cds [Oikopleura dioica]
MWENKIREINREHRKNVPCLIKQLKDMRNKKRQGEPVTEVDIKKSLFYANEVDNADNYRMCIRNLFPKRLTDVNSEVNASSTLNGLLPDREANPTSNASAEVNQQGTSSRKRNHSVDSEDQVPNAVGEETLSESTANCCTDKNSTEFFSPDAYLLESEFPAKIKEIRRSGKCAIRVLIVHYLMDNEAGIEKWYTGRDVRKDGKILVTCDGHGCKVRFVLMILNPLMVTLEKSPTSERERPRLDFQSEEVLEITNYEIESFKLQFHTCDDLQEIPDLEKAGDNMD